MANLSHTHTKTFQLFKCNSLTPCGLHGSYVMSQKMNFRRDYSPRAFLGLANLQPQSTPIHYLAPLASSRVLPGLPREALSEPPIWGRQKGSPQFVPICSDFPVLFRFVPIFRGFEKGLAGGGWRLTGPQMQQKLFPRIVSTFS